VNDTTFMIWPRPCSKFILLSYSKQF
jgi:hypothetical protein